MDKYTLKSGYIEERIVSISSIKEIHGRWKYSEKEKQSRANNFTDSARSVAFGTRSLFTRAFRRVEDRLKYLLTADRVGCATQGARYEVPCTLSSLDILPYRTHGFSKARKGASKSDLPSCSKPRTLRTHRRISLVSF